jgi:hypothetical protein
LIYFKLPDNISVVGDGQFNAVGLTAKSCVYVLEEEQSGHILELEVVDKRETDLKSSSMEIVGLIRTLMRVLTMKKVEDVTTDRHTQIRKLFREFFTIICPCSCIFTCFFR